MNKIHYNIYRIDVPLPIKALKTANIYLVKGKDGLLMIDSGIYMPDAIRCLEKRVAELGFSVNDITNIIITHLHIDHVSGACYIQNISKAKTYMHREDADRIEYIKKDFRGLFNTIKKLYIENGVPKKLIEELNKFHPAFKSLYVYQRIKIDVKLEDNDVIEHDNFNFKIIWTPGHTRGHICLYEEKLRILFSGDHILPNITPNITLTREDLNPLDDYLASLNKIVKLKPKLTLPGHGQSIPDVLTRIKELKIHYQNRLYEIMKMIKNKPLTAYEIAKNIRWDVPYEKWEDYPIEQKYFAIGEALSHIKYLYNKKLITRKYTDKGYIYQYQT